LSLTSELAKEFPDATLTIGAAIPVTAAALALARRDPAHAVELLEPVKAYDHAPSAEFWPMYLRGQAYLELKNGPGARAEFQSIADHHGEVPSSMLYPLAHLGLARAATLANDTEQARKAYEALFALWNEADSNLQPLKDARLEHSRLH
jgi:hypothetical protein